VSGLGLCTDFFLASGMVRSTGPANARYLQGLAMGDIERSAEIEKDATAQKVKWEATSRWARAAQWALAMSLTSSQNDLTSVCEDEGEETILEFTRDATRTLHQVFGSSCPLQNNFLSRVC
jgi:hypothetical protein